MVIIEAFFLAGRRARCIPRGFRARVARPSAAKARARESLAHRPFSNPRLRQGAVVSSMPGTEWTLLHVVRGTYLYRICIVSERLAFPLLTYGTT